MDGGRAGRPGGTDQFGGRDRPLSGAEFAGIGVQFALTLLVFVAAGIWLDRRLGTSPWLLIVCVFAGAGGGFYSMIRRVTAAQRRDAERIAREHAKRDEEGRQ